MECKRLFENSLQEDEQFGKYRSGGSQVTKEMGTTECKEKYRKKTVCKINKKLFSIHKQGR